MCNHGEKHLYLQLSRYQDAPQLLNCKSSFLHSYKTISWVAQGICVLAFNLHYFLYSFNLNLKRLLTLLTGFRENHFAHCLQKHQAVCYMCLTYQTSDGLICDSVLVSPFALPNRNNGAHTKVQYLVHCIAVNSEPKLSQSF